VALKLNAGAARKKVGGNGLWQVSGEKSSKMSAERAISRASVGGASRNATEGVPYSAAGPVLNNMHNLHNEIPGFLVASGDRTRIWGDNGRQ